MFKRIVKRKRHTLNFFERISSNPSFVLLAGNSQKESMLILNICVPTFVINGRYYWRIILNQTALANKQMLHQIRYTLYSNRATFILTSTIKSCSPLLVYSTDMDRRIIVVHSRSKRQAVVPPGVRISSVCRSSGQGKPEKCQTNSV